LDEFPLTVRREEITMALLSIPVFIPNHAMRQ
jgi:hypothetical protein